MPSGEDPIGRSPSAADAAHVMETVTRYEQHDELREPVKEGRFGRDARQDEVVDGPQTDNHSDGDHWEPLVDYQVDPEAVAAAIVCRLLAGRSLGPRADRD
jgi:hypothetical protein